MSNALVVVLGIAVVVWVVYGARLMAEMKATLTEVQAQFRADSGTSLRDVVNRLEVLSEDNRAVVRTLRGGVDVLTQLAEVTQQQVAAGEATGLRIETATHQVADDLAASGRRADDVDEAEPPGTASDAAVRGE